MLIHTVEGYLTSQLPFNIEEKTTYHVHNEPRCWPGYAEREPQAAHNLIQTALVVKKRVIGERSRGLRLTERSRESRGALAGEGTPQVYALGTVEARVVVGGAIRG